MKETNATNKKLNKKVSENPRGDLPVFSVPVMSLNRYCANRKISLLHLFLQLIFVSGGCAECREVMTLRDRSSFDFSTLPISRGCPVGFFSPALLSLSLFVTVVAACGSADDHE